MILLLITTSIRAQRMQLMFSGYNQTFFDETQFTSMRSSKEIVPIILKLLELKSVIDLGCGTGSWLAAFKANGVPMITGVDNASLQNAQLQIGEDEVIKHDLTEPFSLEQQYDLATCLEVAEHLPAACAPQIVENLCRLAPVVLFSAAIPHQGGTGHINEQWPEYWAELFQKQGYVAVDALRPIIWNNHEVAYWYAQNLIFYVQEDRLQSYPMLEAAHRETNPQRLTLIHPKVYVKSSKSLSNPIYLILRFGWNLVPRWLRLRLVKPLGEFIWRQVGTKY